MSMNTSILIIHHWVRRGCQSDSYSHLTCMFWIVGGRWTTSIMHLNMQCPHTNPTAAFELRTFLAVRLFFLSNEG